MFEGARRFMKMDPNDSTSCHALLVALDDGKSAAARRGAPYSRPEGAMGFLSRRDLANMNAISTFPYFWAELTRWRR